MVFDRACGSPETQLTGVIMLTAVKLVDQWAALERRLPGDWETVALRLRTEQPDELAEAARILGPMNVGHAASSSRSSSGARGARRGPRPRGGSSAGSTRRGSGACSSRPISKSGSRCPSRRPRRGRTATPVAEAWDAALGELPSGWSDLLCLLEIHSSSLLPRAALLCAPINPTRDRELVGFTFRCARRKGYGVSPEMARRCFERLDGEAITGAVSVLRVVSDTDNVATQGPVWYVGGKVL